MGRDVKKIIESWFGIENTIHELMKREVKMSIAISDTDIFSGHQFEAMVAIAFFDIHNVTKIAQLIGCSKSATSIMISKMLSKNLVRKTYGHNTQDNRSIYIEITDEGINAIENFMEARLMIVADIYEKLSDNIREELLVGMKCFCGMYGGDNGLIITATDKLLKKQAYPPEKNNFIRELARFVAGRLINGKAAFENPMQISKVLTLQQIGMLKAIHVEGINTVSKLVKAFGTSVSTVSVNVSRLAKAGFIIKEYGKTDDNRETILSVSDKAVHELESVANNCFKIFIAHYQSMNDEDKVLLEQGLEHFDNVVRTIKAEVKTQ